MTLVLIEVTNEAALEKLRRQPDVRVVRIVAETAAVQAPAPRKWAGALAEISPTAAVGWNQYLHDIRNEWERDI